MENEGCEKIKQSSIQFSCKKILAGVNTDKLHAADMQTTTCGEMKDSGNDFESPTPEKPEWKTAKLVGFPTRKQLSDCFENDHVILQSAVGGPGISVLQDSSASEYCKQKSNFLSGSPDTASNELPDKYTILGGLFNRMESSIRLLSLRKKLPTFQNICVQVEVLAKRKLLCSHLSQMKYIFPEAILIEKVLIHDEKSLCVKPDMKVTLLPDAVTCPLLPEQSASMALCQAFQSKLLDFYSSHPEVPDIPEAMLPEPFSQRNQTELQSILPEEASFEPLQQSSDNLGQSHISHLPLSFHKQFSQRTTVPEAEKTQLLASPLSISTSTNPEGMEISNIYHRERTSVFTLKPPEVICTPNRSKTSHLPESTPAKYVINSGDLTMQTPALETPRRPMPTPNVKVVVEDEQLAEVKLTNSTRRSLIYSPSKSEGSMLDPISHISERNKGIQSTFNQTTVKRNLLEEDDNVSRTTQVIGNTDSVSEGSNLCRMGVGRCQEIVASLTDIFDTICRISRSINCSYITKEELLHKIISDNLDIEDTSKVEEQLQLLEKFVPEWICKKVVSSGDIIYSIKQTCDVQAVREKLVEAV